MDVIFGFGCTVPEVKAKTKAGQDRVKTKTRLVRCGHSFKIYALEHVWINTTHIQQRHYGNYIFEVVTQEYD